MSIDALEQLATGPFAVLVSDYEEQYGRGGYTLRIYRNGVCVSEAQDYGEPEDNCFLRDYSWIKPALEDAYRFGSEDVGRELDEAIKGCDVAAKAIVDLENKLQFVLDRTPVEDGCYTFPDGDSWPAGSKAG